MTDLSQTISPKSDQLNADDLITGPRTITITKVVGVEDHDQPIHIFFDGDNGKPYKPGLSMRRVLVQVWGAEGDDYVGKSMTIYSDPEVAYGGIKVGGIRISHMTDIPKNVVMMLTSTRSRRKEYVVKPLATDPAEAILQTAEEAADRGTEAFTEFWNSADGKKNRGALKNHLKALKSRAETADKALESTEDRLQRTKDEEIEPVAAEETPPLYAEEAEVMPGEAAYNEGMKANKAGDPIGECPYTENPDYSNWVGGWEQADQFSQT